MNIVFMGSCPFSLSVLSTLEKKFPICAVYTAPPRPRGRGHKVQQTCVHQHAQRAGYPVFIPSHFKDPESVEAFGALRPTVAIVASYGLILPQSILDIPERGCVNVHPSLLPRWRGASPIVSPLLEGDKKTGISIMVMDAGMDTGPLLYQGEIDIPQGIQADTLSDLLAQRGAQALVDILSDYLEGRLDLVPQSNKGVRVARKITKEDRNLCWSQNADLLVRRVNALVGWPGTWGQVGPFFLKILSAESALFHGKKQSKKISTGDCVIYNGCFAVVCGGQSLFFPTRVQTPQGKVMAMDDFVRGHSELIEGVADVSQ